METTIICSSNAPVIKFRSKFQKQFCELPKNTQLRLNSIFSEFITNQTTLMPQISYGNLHTTIFQGYVN